MPNDDMPHDDFDIKGVTSDSRAVKQGYLFAALKGAKVDGRDYIDQAVENGATFVLAPPGTHAPEGVTFITDKNPRRKFAHICADFYARQPEHIVAVTGTNGKTSIVHFVAQIWKALGKKGDFLGTLNLPLTTPDPAALHEKLAGLADEGLTHLAMEASSHGLHQSRLDGVDIKAAAFTNLTQDHLDYHADMEEYFAAKMRLFNEIISEDGTAVLNADSNYYEQVLDVCNKRGLKVMTYGKAGQDITLVDRNAHPHGQNLTLKINDEDYSFDLELVGGFQASNLMAAIGLVMSEGTVDVAQIIEAVKQITGARGRMQPVMGHSKGAAVYVDYAHTPDALENVLEALRPHTDGRLICIFGCGGDRDRSKRPKMGEIAAKHADIAILTDDNPRSEDPAAIRAEITAGTPDITEIGDRREAIRHAINIAEKGDVIAITGKGHEQGQKIEDQEYPFDDVEEAEKAIKELSQ